MKKTEPKQLTSNECREEIARLEGVMTETIDNKPAWLEADRERAYYEAALVVAEQREAEEIAAKLRAEREAKRPAAEAAGRECMLEHMLTDEVADVRRAVALLADVHRRVGAKFVAIRAARDTYHREYMRQFPLVMDDLTEQAVRDLFGPVVLRALHDADLSGRDQFFYPITVQPVALGRRS